MELKAEPDEDFCTKILVSGRLQSGSPADPGAGTMAVYTADQFGEELLQCIQGIPPAQVLLSISRGQGWALMPVNP